jgi:hypothetical protein
VKLIVAQGDNVKPKRRRGFGAWKGKVWYAPDYDQADAEIEKDFYSTPIFPDEKA